MNKFTAALVAAVALGSVSAQAASLPTSFTTPHDPHEVSEVAMKIILEDLGFTVSDVEKDGRVFDVMAQWEGEDVELRVHTGQGSITQK